MVNTEFDICANRHGGDRESFIAHGRGDKERDRKTVFGFIRSKGDFGSTLDEACVALGRQPNQLSGRFTELKRDGLIAQNGIRRTRTGSPAKVWIVPNQFSLPNRTVALTGFTPIST